VLRLTSPTFPIGAGATAPLLTFDHWVATEPGFDGGNVSVSVNGGPYTLVANTDFTPRSWERVNNLPDNRAGYAMFAPDPDIGTCAPGGDESGVLRLTSPTFPIGAGATAPLLTFDHWVATELGFDGGIVEISVNGGAWTQIATADFSYNAYPSALLTAAQDNTNPLEGRAAFHGTDGGEVDGSWGRSHVDLAGYATGGDRIQLRFSFGTDGCAGAYGWYVDDVTVYACSPPRPTSSTPR